MKYLIINIIFFTFVGNLLPTKVFSQSNNTEFKNVLILVGYQDEQNPESFFKYKYSYSTAEFLISKINLKLQENNFKANADNSLVFINQKLKIKVTLISANAACPNENANDAERNIICNAQITKSNMVRDYLNSSLKFFDEFYYIGHSRLGLGLAIGPFQPEFIFKINFFNEIEGGNLKKISLISCSQKDYYKDNVTKYSKIEFDNFLPNTTIFLEDALNILLKKIDTLVENASS